MDPEILKMLANMSGDVDKKRNKLQQLQAEPIKRSFLENGQSSIDAFLNPSQDQRIAIQGGAAAMLGSDPGHPAKGLSQGIIAGMDLNNQINTQNRAQRLQAQQQSVDNSGDSFNRAVDILGMMPKATADKMGQKFYRNAQTGDIKGLTEKNGLLYNDDEQRVSAQQLAQAGYSPYGGSSAALSGADIDKPPTAKDTRSMINASSTEAAFDSMDKMLEGGAMSDLLVLLQGSIGTPTPLGREWERAKAVIVNGVGRLESGGQIRKDETKDYIKMLTPSVFDIASPDTIKKKIRDGKAAARIFNQIQTKQMTAEQGIEALNQVLMSPIEADQPTGGGVQYREGQTATGPNGEKVTFTNGAWQ
jgi:hypothetical protein